MLPEKFPFYRHPYCVLFHFWSTNSTQLEAGLPTYMEGSTWLNMSIKIKNTTFIFICLCVCRSCFALLCMLKPYGFKPKDPPILLISIKFYFLYCQYFMDKYVLYELLIRYILAGGCNNLIYNINSVFAHLQYAL